MSHRNYSFTFPESSYIIFPKPIGRASRHLQVARDVVAMKSATTVIKVCRIIDELATRQWLGVSDLSRRTTLLPSDVHRILTSLKLSGYVHQDVETKKYQIGTQLLRIGLEACQRNVVYARVYPTLVELSQQLKATTHLAAFDHQELHVFLIADVNGPAEDKLRELLGSETPLHCSALGKVILSTRERGSAASALKQRGMTRYTRRTITDPAALEKQLEEIRFQGYAVDREECYEGVCCLACPVIDWTGEVVGSISTSMPTSRFLAQDEHLIATSLKAACHLAMNNRRVSLPSGITAWSGRTTRTQG
jgi:IclR family KDG regulon transcriptional repressor